MATWYYNNTTGNGWNDVANWKASPKGSGNIPSVVPWTTEDTKADDLYVQNAYDTAINIPLNVQVGSPTNEWSITGTFLNTSGTVVVENLNGGVTSGNWNCSILNRRSLRGGTFNGSVDNSPLLIEPGYGYIFGGTFNGFFTNNGVVNNGTFEWTVTNNKNIYNGVFNGYVSNEAPNGTIYNGIFNGEVSNDRIVRGGVFNGHYINLSTSETTGGFFSGTLTNYYRITGAIFACSSYENLEGMIELGTFVGCSYIRSGTMKLVSPIDGECFISAKQGVTYQEDLGSIVLSDVTGSGLL